MRGRVLRRVTPAGVTQETIGSAEEWVEVLAREFDLDVPEAATLWPRVLARHEEVMAAAAPA